VGVCVTHGTDSTQGGPDDPGGWIQEPRCKNLDDGISGHISDDGKSVDFSCTSNDTSDLNGNGTETNTYVVSGHLTFARGAPAP
jgi:hypothetical protein